MVTYIWIVRYIFPFIFPGMLMSRAVAGVARDRPRPDGGRRTVAGGRRTLAPGQGAVTANFDFLRSPVLCFYVSGVNVPAPYVSLKINN